MIIHLVIEEKTDAIVAGLHTDLVPGIEQHERTVGHVLTRLSILLATLGPHPAGIGGVAEGAVTAEDLGKRAVRDEAELCKLRPQGILARGLYHL